MAETTYQIVRHADDTFAVEVVRFGALPEVAAGFATEAAVMSWIAQDKRLSNTASPMQTVAARKWRQS